MGRLLSLRRAAAELGIDRSTTLPDLIAEGRIGTITLPNGRVKIPATELDRFCSELDPVPRPRARNRPQQISYKRSDILARLRSKKPAK